MSLPHILFKLLHNDQSNSTPQSSESYAEVLRRRNELGASSKLLTSHTVDFSFLQVVSNTLERGLLISQIYLQHRDLPLYFRSRGSEKDI
jgi:hypothetical protein